MFTVLHQSSDSHARVGIWQTSHGTIQTPAYAIVGTHASVRCMTTDQLLQTKTQVLMVNTFHCWREHETSLEMFQGLHALMEWDGPVMTDSGGYQVFSMGAARTHGVGKMARGDVLPSRRAIVDITADGVFFEDHGKRCYLDAETSIGIQQKLGADIIFALDECTSPRHDYDYTKQAMERTHRWAVRSLSERTSSQQLIGIVQGGAFEDLRRQSAEYIGALPFDGYAIGGTFGDSFGSTEEDTFKELSWSIPLLPPDKPRHLLGIGRIDDILYAVEQGIDSFDCSVPTREARHGWLWTREGRIDITKGVYQNDPELIASNCPCAVCCEQGITRGELRERFKSKDPSAGELATIHNVHFFNHFMEEVRAAINEGRFREHKTEVLHRLHGASGQQQG